jgi:hypothetical protein
MANANPFDGRASYGIGQRIERVTDQSKKLFDTDALRQRMKLHGQVLRQSHRNDGRTFSLRILARGLWMVRPAIGGA